MPLKRRLLAGTTQCRFGCQYCFAKSGCYERQPVYDKTQSYSEFDIVYPSCDSELLLERDWSTKLRDLATRPSRYTILRFSTKSVITAEIADNLARINELLTTENKGFLLVGISISTKSRLAEIEPGTANFEQRLTGLSLLADRSVPRNVTLRPLLPFIPAGEYSDIITETRQYTRHYLLGGLYVFRGSRFYDKYIANKYFVSRRRVEWLDARPEWEVIESAELTKNVSHEVLSAGCRQYYCDVDLVSGVLPEPVVPVVECAP